MKLIREEINNMAEINKDTELILQTRLNEVDLEAWSDIDDLQNISLYSLDKNDCIDISEQDDQIQIINELNLPPELMEKIVCYLDGRTLLKFKLLSKSCYSITNTALYYNKLWKKICLNEIPKKYLIDLFNKHFSGKFVPLDSLSEVQYERLYKNWLHWQSTVFNTTLIKEKSFLGLDIIKIICYKFDVIVIFVQLMYEYSLKRNEENGFTILEKKTESYGPNALISLNPLLHTDGFDEEFDLCVTYRRRGRNCCQLHHGIIHIDANRKGHYMGKLIDVDTNIYVNSCCWVGETYYEYHCDIEQNIMNVHYCEKLCNTMYTSVVHGVIIGATYSNRIIIHNMFKDSCIMVNLWLNRKYTGASAIHIYANILFIGSQNGYLLAYRLRCWDDLINLKNHNLLLEMKLSIGRIVKLDIIDFENVKFIVVASLCSVRWIKIN